MQKNGIALLVCNSAGRNRHREAAAGGAAGGLGHARVQTAYPSPCSAGATRRRPPPPLVALDISKQSGSQAWCTVQILFI